MAQSTDRLPSAWALPVLAEIRQRWYDELESRAWLRRLLPFAAIGASAYLAPRASMRELNLIAAAGGLLVCLKWPHLVLVVLAGATLCVPFAIGTGTETSLNIAVILIGLLTVLWLLEMILRQDIRLHSSRTIPPLLTFMAISLLAFAAGNQRWLLFADTASFAAQAGGLSIFLLSGAAFLLVGHRLPSVRWLEAMVWVFLAVAGLYIVARITRVLPVADYYDAVGRHSLFYTWLAAMAFSQAAFNRRLTLPLRLVLCAVLAGTLYITLALTQTWTSGWVPSLVAIAVILWLGSPRLALVIGALAGVGVLLNLNVLMPEIMGGDNEYSAMTRLEAWRILWQIITLNPILGVGFANYYFYTPLFPILGYAVRFNSHNNYVDIVAQTGALGMFSFLWIFWAVCQLGWRLRRVVPEGFPRAYVYGATGGAVATLAAGMLGDWVLPFVYNIGVVGFRASVLAWLFMGGLLFLEQAYAGSTAPAAASRKLAHD